jgi:hypothetical protein
MTGDQKSQVLYTANIYMMVGGRTFRQDLNDFEGFGVMG